MQSSRRTESMGRYAFHAPKLFQQQSTPRRVEGFHSLVKYLAHLRKDGALDDDEFSELVKRAAAASIEAEVADRVERGLKLKIERVLRLKVKRVLEDKIRTDYLLSLPK